MGEKIAGGMFIAFCTPKHICGFFPSVAYHSLFQQVFSSVRYLYSAAPKVILLV